jgi:hypothetical protein
VSLANHDVDPPDAVGMGRGVYGSADIRERFADRVGELVNLRLHQFKLLLTEAASRRRLPRPLSNRCTCRRTPKPEAKAMMQMLGINLCVTVKTSELITVLTVNRETHRKMVEEARAGYLVEARKQLQARLVELNENKPVNLNFKLNVPKDFTKVYDTTIGMLKQHTGETVELTADEYRHLVEDEWDWTREFINTNLIYSRGTREFAIGKGFDVT